MRPIAIFAALLLTLTGCTQAQDPPKSHESNIGVQLFMWNWNSIAAECEFLAQAGYDWVLTSPPQEHITGDPWWVHYQPVSYELQSRLGTEAQFKEMVQSCGDHGIEIITDAVINHMSAQDSGVGYFGTEFSKSVYPGLYNESDFHNCQLTANNQILNYNNVLEVQSCELLGLSDLNTSKPEVIATLKSYLEKLLDTGVAGVRIDAAKHIYAPELAVILEDLPEATVVMHEVIAGGPLQPEQYTDTGLAWEFEYPANIKSYFDSNVISSAANASRWSGYLPSTDAISFITNHDTERNRSALSFREPKVFEFGTAILLAEGYGSPQLYSAYAFDDYDFAPIDNRGLISSPDCDSVVAPNASYTQGEWICQHRWQSTINMIEFRKQTDGKQITNTKKDRGIFGMGREDAGYFLINIGNAAYSAEIETMLPPGVYCDVYNAVEDCDSYKIEIDDDSILRFEIPAETAIAIHRGLLDQ